LSNKKKLFVKKRKEYTSKTVILAINNIFFVKNKRMLAKFCKIAKIEASNSRSIASYAPRSK